MKGSFTGRDINEALPQSTQDDIDKFSKANKEFQDAVAQSQKNMDTIDHLISKFKQKWADKHRKGGKKIVGNLNAVMAPLQTAIETATKKL